MMDFIGGDFNMAVNGPVATVFNDQEFQAAGASTALGTRCPQRGQR